MKKIVSIVVALCMLVSICAMPVMAEEAVAITQVQTKDIITITVDGVYVDCAAYGQLPVIVEGRTLVPLRSVFEALGATVEWQNETRSVASTKGEIAISLAIDSKEMVVNGTVKTLDVPAQIMNERTMVPVRAVAEAFGCKVDWNNDTRTVVIMTQPVQEEVSTVEETPEAVVKQAIDAAFTLDFGKAAAFYKNPDEAMGEFAGMTDVESIIGAAAGGEDLTDEQVKIVEKFTLDIMSLIKYEITGSKIDGNTAEVYVKLSIPDLENIDIEGALTDEVTTILYIEALEKLGYTVEDIYSLTAEDEAKLTNALLEGMFEYFVEIIRAEVETAGYVTTDEVEMLEKVDGKWLIIE